MVQLDQLNPTILDYDLARVVKYGNLIGGLINVYSDQSLRIRSVRARHNYNPNFVYILIILYIYITGKFSCPS